MGATSPVAAAAVVALAAAVGLLSLPVTDAFAPEARGGRGALASMHRTRAVPSKNARALLDVVVPPTELRMSAEVDPSRTAESAAASEESGKEESGKAIDDAVEAAAANGKQQQPPSSSSDDGDDGDEEPWWKSVTLSDAALPLSIRPDFPILTTKVGAAGADESELKPLVYLDSAATSQKPTYVLNALTDYYEKTNSNVHRGAHCLSREATSQYERARDNIADFVNAYSRNEIVFTSGATEAINLVAGTYARSNLKAGDEVIITELEHHSNIVPWQIVCQEKGAKLRVVPVDPINGCPNWDEFESMLNERTKIVSVQHVSNVMGCVNPTERIVASTRSKGHPDVKIMFDACQSVPHMKVDVQSLGCDFLAASGHKMCGPTGIGFLWGKEEILNSMEPYMGGGEMIDEVYNEYSTYAPAPARFEAGTPAIAQSIGLGAAIEYLNQIGMDRIEKYEHELGAYLHRRLDEIPGVTVLGPGADVENRAALLSFVCDGVHPSDLSTFLDMEGVAIRAGHHCCQPLHRALGYSHSARASLYFYNTKEECDFFVEKLVETLEFFRGMEAGGDGSGEGAEGGDETFVPFI